MTFQPIVPFGGVGGWSYLSRIKEAQQATFDKSPMIRRDTEYFETKIASVTRAEDLVSNRRLLRVALGAFGLDDDLNNRFFIRKVLEGGTIDPKSLANRMADKRYAAMAKQFGFGDVTPPFTVLSDFGKRITSAYRERQFEAAVGQTAPDMRLALSLDRELGDIAGKKISENAKWFTVFSNPPLRSVFEKTFSLPASTGTLDLDRQLRIFQDKAAAHFGSADLGQFTDPARIESLRTRFLAQSTDAPSAAGHVRGATALALLQQSG